MTSFGKAFARIMVAGSLLAAGIVAVEGPFERGGEDRLASLRLAPRPRFCGRPALACALRRLIRPRGRGSRHMRSSGGV